MLNVLRTPRLPSLDSSMGHALLLDADRTLGPTDATRAVGSHFGVNDEIRRIFETYGYSAAAAQAVAGVWSRLDVEEYLEVVALEAEKVHLRPEWATVLSAVRESVHVEVVTAGIPQLWRHVLERYGHGNVHVWGGCHARLDSYAVDPLSKMAIAQAHKATGRRVCGAGDSELDLHMLQVADLALFVADAKGSPRLRQRLAEIPGVRHFVTDHQRFEGLPSITPQQLVGYLLESDGGHHAARPH